MFETATMLPAAAILVALVTLLGVVLLLLGCLQCLFPKKKKGFSTLEEGSELDSSRARSNPSFAPDLDSSDTVINIEPLPETVGDLHASSLPPLRPRITCLEKGRLDNLLKSITFHHPFSRSQILYLKEIGHGWFGQVIESEAEKIIAGVSRSRVVVKHLKDDSSQMEQSMFLADVAAYREMEHTNLLRLLGQCTETHPFLMILEYMAMGDLKSYLRTHTKEADMLIRKNRLLKFAIDAASGLGCLHRHGYTHCDFSARNCLVSADFVVKVGDYGVSEETFREDYFNTGRELLPIRWMAPESLAQSNGTWCAQAPSKEGDMWAFGVMLWEVISLGQQPYKDLLDEAMLNSVVTDRSLKLSKPATAMPLSDRLFEIMQFCWLNAKQRIKVEQVHSLLQHILSQCSEPPASEAPPENSFEERWNGLIPNSARASLPKKPTPVATPAPAAQEVDENFSRMEVQKVTAEAVKPKVPPGRGDASVAGALEATPTPLPRASKKVDAFGDGDAAAAKKPPQPPISADKAATTAPIAAARAAAKKEASGVGKTTTDTLASTPPGEVKSDRADVSEVIFSAAAHATPKADVEPPGKEVPPEVPVSIPAVSSGVKVIPPKEKPEDAKSYGEGADVQAAFEALSACDNSDSAADVDHHSSSANTTLDSFLMVDMEDAAHAGLDASLADPHRTSTPAQASPQSGTGDVQRMHLTPDAGETSENTTAASFFTARDSSTSPDRSGFQTAEATLNKDESSTAGMFGEFANYSFSTQASDQDTTLPVSGQDEVASGQSDQLLTSAEISSVEQALFEASQEEEDAASHQENAAATLTSKFGEDTLVYDEAMTSKYESTEEGEVENWNHFAAAETLSSDISFDWEKVSETEVKDEAAALEASRAKTEDPDLSFGVTSLSSTSAASGDFPDKASLELGSLENVGSTSDLDPAPQATESNDPPLIDAADVVSLSSETSPPLQPEGSLEEPPAEQVSLEGSSSTEVTTSPAGELSPSSGLSTPSQVALGTKDEKLPAVAHSSIQDQLSLAPSTPAAVQIVIQDFSDGAPSLDLPASSESSKTLFSTFGLSTDPPLLASTPTDSSDPFSFLPTTSPGQEVAPDPFESFGVNEPFSLSRSEEGSDELDKKPNSIEPQQVSTGLSTDLLESVPGVQEATMVGEAAGTSGQSQASLSSVTDSNVLDFDQFSTHDSHYGSMEPTSLVLEKALKDASPSPRSGTDNLLDFSFFEEGPEGEYSTSASTENIASEITSQSLGLMQSQVGLVEKQESRSVVAEEELAGWDQLRETGLVPAAVSGTGEAPASLSTAPSQLGSPQVAAEVESLPDQNFSSLDSQASSDLLAEDSSLLDFGMAAPSEAKLLHGSASTVALVDLDEFAGEESTPTEGESEATRSAVDDLLGM